MKRQKADMEELMPHLIQEWRRFTKIGGPPDVLQTREFRGVVESLKKIRQDFGLNHFSDRKLLADYMLYFWPLHYQEALSILSEIPTTPKRVLDVCSGPCPVAFAALKLGCSEVIAMDQNLEALKLGANFCGRQGHPITIRKADLLKDNLPVDEKFDLITIGHGFENLGPQNYQQLIHKLINHLTPEGYLVLIESSRPEINRRILQLRESLVEKKIPVQAPCVWRGKCPALENNFPCFAQREYEKPYVMKELQRAMQVNLGSLKASYLILRSPGAGWPKLPEKELYRVVSPPFEKPEGKQFYLCGTPGKKKICSRLQKLPKSARAFEYLKRGELICIEEAIENTNSLHLKEETSVKVEAACGKPIPEVF